MVKYSVNITKFRNKICLNLHYNASSRFLYANGMKIHQLKAKDFEVKPYSLCFENISKDFTFDNMKKTDLKGLL